MAAAKGPSRGGSTIRDRLVGQDFGRLLPEVHTRFASLVSEVLICFLDHLPAHRLERIHLPPAASAGPAALAVWLAGVCAQCPTLHKLAQLLARDRRLTSDLRHRLQALESFAPSGTHTQVRALLDAELGPGGGAGFRILDRPVAEASVALIWPFESAHGPGVFKVLKPGVETRLQEDLRAWEAVGALLDERCEALGLPGVDYAETIDAVKTILLQEVQPDREQAHLALAADLYADVDAVEVPALLPWCTSRVTAMSRLTGCKITEAPGQGPRMAGLVAEFLVAHPLWTAQDRALFHGDPHAGNLMVTDEGRLGILDWSAGVRLDARTAGTLVRLLISAVRLDGQGIIGLLNHLAVDPVDARGLRDVVDAAIRAVRCGHFPGAHWLVGLLDAAVARGGLRLDDQMLLLRKCLLILEGVISDLAPDCSLDLELSRSAWIQLVRESWQRPWMPPTGRDLGTRVSNFDLLSLACAGPEIATRWWAGWFEDWDARLNR